MYNTFFDTFHGHLFTLTYTQNDSKVHFFYTIKKKNSENTGIVSTNYQAYSQQISDAYVWTKNL